MERFKMFGLIKMEMYVLRMKAGNGGIIAKTKVAKSNGGKDCFRKVLKFRRLITWHITLLVRIVAPI